MTTPTKTKCLKKLYLLFLLYAGIGFAQNLNIPDANFKAKLLDANTTNTIAKNMLGVYFKIDSNLDGEIQITEALEVSYLDVNNSNIFNLTGIENFTNIVTLNCNANFLSTLDVSNLSLMQNLNCVENPLVFLNIKNGNPLFTNINLPQNTILEYICVDENRINLITAIANLDTVVGSYCTFTPGGNYNTITGTLKYDDENNGCDAGDLAQAYAKILITDGQNSGISFIDNFGNYTFYTQAGNFEIAPQVQNPTYFTITPATVGIDFADNNNNVRTQDFCITANGIHPDLEVILTPIGVARPGQDATYKLIYKNKGNQTQAGSINLSFDDSKTDFVSAIPEVANQGLNSLIWIYSSLLPFETREIDFTLNVNSPQENPAVNVDDVLNFTASINFAQGDETPTDNFFNLNQIVVNALDPNNKICLEGRTILVQRIGDYLHYNINFENIGTADAVNVVVKDIIDTSKLDINSFQLLYASDTLQTKVDNSKIEFIFKNINLLSPATHPIGGHGNVLFKIKTLPTLHLGDEVVNNANIYFDYNAPILTNDARTTFGTLSNSVFIKDNSVVVYPNPATSKINIKADNAIKSIEIYDVQGRILEIISGESKESLIDLSNKSNGVYFLKISTNKGSKIEKVVKE